MRPQCRIKEKINNRNLDEGLKKQLCQLIRNSSYPEKSENEVVVLQDELFTLSTDANNAESEDECACKLNLCVITREESLILDLIDRLEDPFEKREVLEKYLDLVREKEKPKPKFKSSNSIIFRLKKRFEVKAIEVKLKASFSI
ncbi:hypothetical protein DVH24_034172 [Malus domestica]|uniref:Uncharacterized protein n=1 Tax=Malus domestica TaxID=3750 RepID=A0A498IAH3_MALDO|nr:hypothetical protein DVH24_034172 [Malus domestica]